MARRPAKPPITISGYDEFRAAYRQAAGVMEDKEVAGIMLEGARVIAKVVKRRAPKGPTGRLKKSVRAKKSRRYPKHSPRAWAAIDRKRARHAHLVENGHAIVRGGRRGKGGRVVGNVPAKPFFRPGVNEAQGKARTVVVAGLSRGLNAIKARRRRSKP